MGSIACICESIEKNRIQGYRSITPWPYEHRDNSECGRSLHGNVKGLIDMDTATKNRIGKLEDKIFLPIGKWPHVPSWAGKSKGIASMGPLEKRPEWPFQFFQTVKWNLISILLLESSKKAVKTSQVLYSKPWRCVCHGTRIDRHSILGLRT